jgi:PadR family transcriptional regulator
MKKPAFFILLALADRQRHGSGIMRDVLDLTDGELRLWPATLYGSLDELNELGWINSLDEAGQHPEGESERKRYYRITAAGRRALLAETERMEAIASLARSRAVRTGRRA